MKNYYAHSLPDRPPAEWQPLAEGLKNVVEMAWGFYPWVAPSMKPKQKTGYDLNFKDKQAGFTEREK